jgi:DNA-directed RNA polymerase subunit B
MPVFGEDRRGRSVSTSAGEDDSQAILSILWEVARSYIEEYGLVKRRLRSYNHFVRERLQSVIQEFKNYRMQTRHGLVEVGLGAVEVGKPSIVEANTLTLRHIKPSEARLRNLTYEAPIYVYMNIYLDGKPVAGPSPERVWVGTIPVMVKSDICLLSKMTPDELMSAGEDPNDPGGYFIINGSERVIMALEDVAPNSVVVAVWEDGDRPRYSAVVCSSVKRSRVEASYSAGGPIRVYFGGVDRGVPAVILLRALGLTRDEDIASLVSPLKEVQELLQPSFREAEGVVDPSQALDYVGEALAPRLKRDKAKYAGELIDGELFPHLGTGRSDRPVKAAHLCEMMRRALEVGIGIRKPDEPGSYSITRVRLESDLLSELYREAFSRLFRDMYTRINLESTNPFKLRRGQYGLLVGLHRAGDLFSRSTVSNYIQQMLSTGEWPGGLATVTQPLNRLNHLAVLEWSETTLQALRRLPLLCEVTNPSRGKKDVLNWVYRLHVIRVEEAIRKGGVLPPARVFVDGVMVGFHDDGRKLAADLRGLRREGLLSRSVNIAYYRVGSVEEVVVNTDAGRVRRPFIVVRDGAPTISQYATLVRQGSVGFDDLVNLGVVEFLDADEEACMRIAQSPGEVTSDHTHLEITPLARLGVAAASTPYFEYGSSNASSDRAVGLPHVNFDLHTETHHQSLVYPQAPIVTTRVAELAGLHRRPTGQNLIVAVLGVGGGGDNNLRHAFVLNRASAERGLGLSLSWKLYGVELIRYPDGQSDILTVPNPTFVEGCKDAAFYRLLDEDGLVRVGEKVPGGAAIIGRVRPPCLEEGHNDAAWRDDSVYLPPSETGTVDAVFLTTSAEGNKLAKVVLKNTHFTVVGDGFFSRHGQKGVVGMLIPQEDMPYTKDGTVPDLIIDPSIFPSDIPIGQLIEGLAGKLGSIKGELVDGTPFIGKPVEELRAELEALGFKSSGRELLYSGVTGKALEAEIFIGVVYYQKTSG